MSDLRYVNLSPSELAALALTDPGAQQYVAEHATEYLEALSDSDLEYYNEAIDAYNEGKADCLSRLHDEYDERLLDAIEACDEIKQDSADKRLTESIESISALLAEIHAELNDDDS